MRATFAMLTAIAGLLASSLASAETLRIATWNLNNLHFETGEPLRARAPARSDADYETLRRYAARLDADIVAFQEVNGPIAAHRVFPEDEYQVIVSGRYEADLASGRATDFIYTGFAIRRGTVSVFEQGDVRALSLDDRPGRPVRRGTEILVEANGQRLRLLSVHLKSGCFAKSLKPPQGDACETLALQLDPLEDWIDAQAASDTPFVILGDFNRALDVHGVRDHLWQEIDDGAPAGLKLWRLPFNRESQCWAGTRAHHGDPIDFIVLDDRAWQMVDRESFRQIDYDPGDQDLTDLTPSDHCPISVELRM